MAFQDTQLAPEQWYRCKFSLLPEGEDWRDHEK